jgi:anti-sigma factor RsiW
VTTACRDLEVLLSLRAAGALDPDEVGPVEAHLASCAACREQAALAGELVGLARLPQPGEPERRALADLPERTLRALNRREVRRGIGKRILVGAAVAAAAALAVVAPAIVRRAPPATPIEEAAAVWETPDPDALWEETDILEFGSAADGGTSTEAVFAALDAGAGG